MNKDLRIYHNPRCKHSRSGLAYLESKTSDFTLVKYLEKGISEEEIREILLKMNKRPFDLIRTQEAIYKSNFKAKKFTDDEWIKILCENPQLMQRPIVVGKYKAILANPPENVDGL